MKKSLILIALILAFSPMAQAEDTADSNPVSFIGSWGEPENTAGYDESAGEKKGHPFKSGMFNIDKSKQAEMLAKYDTDGDGALSDTEKTAMHTAMKAEMEAKKAEMLAKFDADGDGSLSDTERQAMQTARKAEMEAKMLEKFDTDGDGTLSDTEKAAMEKNRPARVEGKGQRGPKGGQGMRDGKMPEEMLTKFDTDGDGSLSDTEKAAMQTAMKAEMEAKKAEMLTKFDTDGDGSLSDTERQAMQTARKADMQAKMLEKFDTDGDGTLSDTEKAAMEKNRPARGEGKGPRGGQRPGMKNRR
ncbi:MAG: hypothetical protein A2W80_07030 [Candidatus Riflebacteria bacterium GWC2_50_8]|nr:MAG: hypothetical protein A2W80_07030 [Candidatus Riflebacteria bacterium GWC2_50_8]